MISSNPRPVGPVVADEVLVRTAPHRHVLSEADSIWAVNNPKLLPFGAILRRRRPKRRQFGKLRRRHKRIVAASGRAAHDELPRTPFEMLWDVPPITALRRHKY